MTQPSTGLPSPERVIELLGDEFARAGYEIEDVTIDTHGGQPCVRIVADGDDPLDMDTVAELSRSASAVLDAVETGDRAYILEVSSPGVDRPLTAEKHFRRAHGRKVEMQLVDSTTVVGRIGAVADGAADLVIRTKGGWAVRRIPLAEVRKAVVQVDFSGPGAQELELLGDTVGTRGTEVGA